jgi:hypothetical protein
MAAKLPFVRSAAIYGFKDKVFMVPYARTGMGFSVFMPWVTSADKSDLFLLGHGLLDVLDRCVDDASYANDGKANPALAALAHEAGLKSWKSFHEASVMISALQKPASKKIKFEPWRRVGRSAKLIDGMDRHSGLEPKEIGKAILETLADAR